MSESGAIDTMSTAETGCLFPHGESQLCEGHQAVATRYKRMRKRTDIAVDSLFGVVIDASETLASETSSETRVDPVAFFAFELTLNSLFHASAALEIFEFELNFMPSAYVLLRSQSETVARLKWLLGVDDDLQRRARLLVFLEERARAVSQIDEARNEPEPTGFALSLDEGAKSLRSSLEGKVDLLAGIPSMASMLDSVFESNISYGDYRFMSQFAHGTLLNSLGTRPPFAYWGVVSWQIWLNARLATQTLFGDLLCKDVPLDLEAFQESVVSGNSAFFHDLEAAGGREDCYKPSVSLAN